MQGNVINFVQTALIAGSLREIAAGASQRGALAPGMEREAVRENAGGNTENLCRAADFYCFDIDEHWHKPE